MRTVRVTKGKHTWFTEHENGQITMETDWATLAKEIDEAISNLNINPAPTQRKRGRTIKTKSNGRQ